MHNTSTSPPPQPPPTTFLVRRRHPWPPPSPSPAPAWLPEGLHRRRESPPLHAIVWWSFRIPVQSLLLPHLGWKRGSRSHRGHHTCASTRRCRSCGAGVVAPRTSRPRSRQCLCGSVIPAFWSTRVCVRTPAVTVLLIDRSLGISGVA
jgi:hypothetical protein